MQIVFRNNVKVILAQNLEDKFFLGLKILFRGMRAQVSK